MTFFLFSLHLILFLMILPSSFFFNRMNDLLKDRSFVILKFRHPGSNISQPLFISNLKRTKKNPLEKIIILEEAIDTDSSVYELSNHSL